MKKKCLGLICIMFSVVSLAQQEVQQVEVVKNDKQVEELLDQLGDSEMKLDVIDLLSQPALISDMRK